ncbi:hypothetical protein SB748_21270 [Rhizobium sp. SIMBA_035]|jgi:hypothetical protein
MLKKVTATVVLSLGLATVALAQSGNVSADGASASGSSIGTISGSRASGTNDRSRVGDTDKAQPGTIDPSATNSTINSGDSNGTDVNDCRSERRSARKAAHDADGNVISPGKSAACGQ